jgi:hypothetical protein
MGVQSLTPTQVGVVSLRQVPTTTRYEAVLYTRSEPACN